MFTHQRDKYLFNVDEYKICGYHDRGGCGIIHIVENKENHKKYATKTQFIHNKRYIFREIDILIFAHHPTIIQFKGFSYTDFNKEENITILMEYMEKGSLQKYIELESKCLKPNEYNNTQKQIILIGIARGMMLLHKYNIIHRDLKPANVLLDDDLFPRITDFGFSKFFHPNHQMSQSTSGIGTISYMAPELLNFSNHYDIKVDVYAFGILMYEVLTGNMAYSDLPKEKRNMENIRKIVCEGERPKIKENEIKKSLQAIIEKCWSQNPAERPSFTEIYNKISLSKENDFYFGFSNPEKDVIKFKDDKRDIENDELFDICTTYCLDDVFYDDIIEYVNKINQELKTPRQREIESKMTEFEKMKKDIDDLKQTNENQKLQLVKAKKVIKEQKNELNSIYEKIDKDKNEFTEKISLLTEQINALSDKLTQQNVFIENIKKDKQENMVLFAECRFQDYSSPYGILSHVSNYVTISSSENYDEKMILNITKYDDNCFEYFGIKTESDCFIEFDFKSMKIDLYAYLIRSNKGGTNADFHPRTWRIEGSNDKKKWDQLDRQENVNSLNKPLGKDIFQCKGIKHGNGNCRYRYIRYIQESAWYESFFRKKYNIFISYFELYGNIYINN